MNGRAEARECSAGAGRWGTGAAPHPPSLPPIRHSSAGRNPPLHHPCVPHPSFLRRQEPTHPNTSSLPPSPIHPSPLSGGRLGGGGTPRAGGNGVQVFRFLFFRLFRGDPGGIPIWSERLAAFRFVQVCSDLFRVVRGVIGVNGRAEARECSVGAGRRGIGAAPPIRHSCAGRNHLTPTPPPPSPIHPSPSQGEVRWGVERRERSDDVSVFRFLFSGCSRVIRATSLSGRSVRQRSGLFGFVQGCSGRDRGEWPRRGAGVQRRSRAMGDWRCAPSAIPAPHPSFLRRQEPASPSPLRPPSVISAQAGTHPPQHLFPPPFPNSSLPPFRGEVRGGWNAASGRQRCSGVQVSFFPAVQG